ncbi:hypothetical protein [Gemmatimonas sp.]|uniref:hypothetical protein n=1 Tax=Gemmatimonas sp. TaxID=1962908 RepID=UPI00286E0E70|nr:hypothetical protein [Gemmatimonas sp.]
MTGSERDLVDKFAYVLASDSSPWGPVRFTREFDYRRGRTDVVALDDSGEVIAVEAKLTRWRDALQQAYRNRCFAHSSYVLLPKPVALRAIRYAIDFEARGVGVCYFEGDELSIVLHAVRAEPLQPWLCQVAEEWITGEMRDSKSS